MKRGINQVILVGNLGSDPDLKYMQSGKAVLNISLATSEGWEDKTTGEQHERTEWHRVVLYGRQAEVVNQYCRKGSQLYIQGKNQTRRWKDGNGQDRYTTEVIADEMQMMGMQRETQNQPSAEGNGGNYMQPPS